MNLTDFATPAEIRSALGVSSTEINDANLTLGIHALMLQEKFDEVSPLIEPVYYAVRAIAEQDRTDLQNRFYRTAKLFAMYAVAQSLMMTMPMFSVQELEDGKARFKRFDDAYAELGANVSVMFSGLKFKLIAAFNALQGSTAITTTVNMTPVLGVTTGLAVDPVTAGA